MAAPQTPATAVLRDLMTTRVAATTPDTSEPMIAGTASGSSTRHSSWRRVSPIPLAASSTSGGALRSPATMFGKRMTSV